MSKPPSRLIGWGNNLHGAVGALPLHETLSPTNIDLAPDVRIRQMAAGGSHSVIVDDLGRLWVTGKWSSGLRPQSSTVFERIGELENVRTAECGWNSIFAVKNDGSIYYSATTSFDKFLGNCSIEPRTNCLFKLLVFGKPVKDVAVGWRHILLLTEEGDVYSIGKGNSGQLGFGRRFPLLDNPTKVEIGEKILNVRCGWKFSAALSESQRVYVWGSNSHGQCTLDPLEVPSIPYPKLMQLPEPIKQISCGWAHMICLSVTGKLYCWGRNDFYQIRYDPKNASSEYTTSPLCLTLDNCEKITHIACGSEHNVVLCDGKMYFWGWNEHRTCPESQNDFLQRPQFSTTIDALEAKPSRICSGLSHVFAIFD